MTRSRRLGCLLAGPAAGILILAAGASAGKPDPDLKPPTLLGPKANVAMTAGTTVTFRIRTHARDAGLWLNVSRSRVKQANGAIGHEVALVRFQPTGKPAVYQATPPGLAFPNSWANTPGVYYWQAWRKGGKDGCVESQVRTLRVMPRPPLALSEARLEGRFDAVTTVTAVQGFSIEVGDTDDVTLTFAPSCSKGACDVRLSLPVENPLTGFSSTLRMALARSGGGYSGSTPAELTKCSFAPVTGTLELRIEVGEAAWIGNVWRVTRLVGYERYSTPDKDVGVYKCPAASYEGSVAASLGK